MSTDPTLRETGDASARLGTSTSPSSMGTWAWRLAKYATFAVVLFFVARELLTRFRGVEWSHTSFRAGFLVLAAAFQMLASLVGPLVFRLLLKAQSNQPSWRALLTSVWIARIGKYIPGKFASTLGAIWMLHRQGLAASAAASATLLSQGMMVLAGLMTALPVALWPPTRQAMPAAWWLCVILLAIGSICIHPRVFSIVGSLLTRKLGMPPSSLNLRFADYVKAFAALLLGQVLGGVMLWLLLSSVVDAPPRWIPLCISAGAMAGTASLLAIFAPGGLGVREGILLIILGQIMSVGDSAIVVVVARLVQVVVEVLLAFAGLLLARQSFRRSPHA